MKHNEACEILLLVPHLIIYGSSLVESDLFYPEGLTETNSEEMTLAQ